MTGKSSSGPTDKQLRARETEKNKALWHLAKRGSKGAKRALVIKGGKEVTSNQ